MLCRKWAKYNTWFFDCDGVLIDSNHIKEQAFYQTALEFGDDIAKQFMVYSSRSHGISRFKQISHLVDNILCRQDNNLIDRLVNSYGDRTKQGLKEAQITEGCIELLDGIEHAKSYVVSGSEELELTEMLIAKGLYSKCSDCFGSPRIKEEIIRNLKYDCPAVLVGDSAFDSLCAQACGLDFIFISGYTETVEDDLAIIPVASVANLGELLK